MIKRTNCLFVNFTIPTDHRPKVKESNKLDKYLKFKEIMKDGSNSNIKYCWSSLNNPEKPGKVIERNLRQSWSQDSRNRLEYQESVPQATNLRSRWKY